MIKINEVEEIIRLIYKGFDLELLSFELEIPMQQLQEYKKRLELRKFVNDSMKNQNLENAIDILKNFIESTDNNIIERFMLLKLKAYANKATIDEEELHNIEEERKKLGIARNIDEILSEIKINIPKRKSCNIKQIKTEEKQSNIEDTTEENTKEHNKVEPNYEEAIVKYKKEIALNPKEIQTKQNLLAFAYFKAGKIDEARKELIKLIETSSNYTAYRQLVHLERIEGNIDDAKLWAYDGIEKFPNDIKIRERLISIAREENDNQEIIKLLKEIISIEPKNEKNKKRLETIMNAVER